MNMTTDNTIQGPEVGYLAALADRDLAILQVYAWRLQKRSIRFGELVYTMAERELQRRARNADESEIPAEPNMETVSALELAGPELAGVLTCSQILDQLARDESAELERFTTRLHKIAVAYAAQRLRERD